MRSIAVVVAMLLLGPRAVAAEEASLADRVSRSRIEVDDLAQRLRDRRREAQDDLAARRAERTDLERQVRLEEIRRQTLAQIRAERLDRASGLEGRAAKWRAPLAASIAAAKDHVERSLPYKRAERIETLERIEADLEIQHPDYAIALAKLWRFVEEEEALGRETSHARQLVRVDDERLLVDVVHVGMALLYLRAADGRLGWARPADDGWTFEWLREPEALEAVDALFTAFEENRVVGPRRVIVYEEAPR